MIIKFALGLGLAGAAGIRAYFPLLVMGLLSRYSEILSYRPPFKIFSSLPVLILLILLAVYELVVHRMSFDTPAQTLLTAGLRVVAGAILFAGVFPNFGTIGGLVFGGLVALLSQMVIVRLFKTDRQSQNRSDVSGIGIEESLAIMGTVLAILIPWMSYFVWGGILFVLVKKVRENNRYKPNIKAKPWR